MILLISIACLLLSVGEAFPQNPSSRYCEHTATSRNCWGEYDVDTDYSEVFPDTGVIREYWLTAQNVTLAPNGYERPMLVFNGTFPGPTIEADWGDTLVIHVKNDMQHNGTAIHWHGIRQLNNNQHDGVPGVTQCPIAPGDSMTYRLRLTQYGTGWYHSHLGPQMGDGLYGALVIRGPHTADYDVDLGPVFLTDWFHGGTFAEFERSGKFGGFPLRTNSIAENGLINGTNTYDCSGSSDSKCKGDGKRNLVTFEPGKKYLIRLIDSQIDSGFSFSIDGHKLKVIAMDYVPIKPYITDSVAIGSGQRYDIIVEADQNIGNYWMRAIYQTCAGQDNKNKNNIRGIVRYEGAEEADPTTTNLPNVVTRCDDEPAESLVPQVPMDVGASEKEQSLLLGFFYELSTVFHWTLNTRPLTIDWQKPTNKYIQENDTEAIYPVEYNVYDVPYKDKWTYWVIQETVLLFNVYHPFHLHGHDFHVLAQGEGIYNPLTVKLNLKNPPRRDTASMPGNGYLVIAFKTDNPGTWLFHCHIAWHASQNLALQFVERESEIADVISVDYDNLDERCKKWEEYVPNAPYHQEDSGI
ncbi:unnamed protein product [Clonostachys byssicola]|uniref:laccase n=1 Tax=Clonostachys byssicola TaxID=160290 RepID=A0A9N9UH04_9HYPO|nr:unnamed protein product [Clonostachys byssicola]